MSYCGILAATKGALCYNDCTLAELRQFCEDRGISATSGSSRVSQSTLTGVLDRADEIAGFGRLLDLPAELRIVIYQFHVEWLGFPAERDFLNQQALDREKARLPYQVYPMAMVPAAMVF